MDAEYLEMVDLNVAGIEQNAPTIDQSEDDLKYISLRDIIPQLPAAKGVAVNHDHNFNSSNITIRNQLVRRAASAYVQSAAILSSQDQNSLLGAWENAARPATLSSIWREYIVNPLKACIRFIVKPICRIVAYMGNRICL